MIRDSTDEVEGARPIKLHNALAIIECDDGIAYVAVVIAPFFYLKNWIILVIESCKTKQQYQKYMLGNADFGYINCRTKLERVMKELKLTERISNMKPVVGSPVRVESGVVWGRLLPTQIITHLEFRSRRVCNNKCQENRQERPRERSHVVVRCSLNSHVLLRRSLGQGTMEMELKSGLKKEKSIYMWRLCGQAREVWSFEIVRVIWDTWPSLGECVPFGG